jgi:hypothetical protein
VRQTRLDEFIKAPAKKFDSLMSFVDQCRYCGEGVCTGSQLFYICPVDGSWHGVWDSCKFYESFSRVYGRPPTRKELETYIQYIRLVGSNPTS